MRSVPVDRSATGETNGQAFFRGLLVALALNGLLIAVFWLLLL